MTDRKPQPQKNQFLHNTPTFLKQAAEPSQQTNQPNNQAIEGNEKADIELLSPKQKKADMKWNKVIKKKYHCTLTYKSALVMIDETSQARPK